jgi:hypothetical protein
MGVSATSFINARMLQRDHPTVHTARELRTASRVNPPTWHRLNLRYPAPPLVEPFLLAAASPKPPSNISRSTKDVRILRGNGTTVPHRRSADDMPHRCYPSCPLYRPRRRLLFHRRLSRSKSETQRAVSVQPTTNDPRSFTERLVMRSLLIRRLVITAASIPSRPCGPTFPPSRQQPEAGSA